MRLFRDGKFAAHVLRLCAERSASEVVIDQQSVPPVFRAEMVAVLRRAGHDPDAAIWCARPGTDCVDVIAYVVPS